MTFTYAVRAVRCAGAKQPGAWVMIATVATEQGDPMKFVLLACALSFAGCAGQPNTAASAAAPAAVKNQPQQTAPDSEREKQRLHEAMKRGYRLVNTNGEELYCRTDWATGSHIQQTTVCLTARQLDEIHLQNQQMLERPNPSINSH
jgi:hypothetical protein